MAHVFISYSRKDQAFVRTLDSALKQHNLDTWVDWEGIPPSADWRAEIYAAIDAADTVVFVVSPDSVSSEVCQEEVSHAVADNKRIVPVVCRPVDPNAAPEAVRRLNWLFFTSADFDNSLSQLVQTLTTDLDWVHAHTRLLVRAVEWEARGQDASLALRGRDLREAEQQLAAIGPETQPQPTTLQRQYVLASRRHEAGRQRLTLGAVTFGLLVAVALGLLAWSQRNAAVAESQVRAAAQATAIAEANERATAEANAIAETNTRATAEANAEARRKEAEAQRQLAVARQLAAQSEQILGQQAANQPEIDEGTSLERVNKATLTRAILLAVESLRHSYTSEGFGALYDGLSLFPKLQAQLRADAGISEYVGFAGEGTRLVVAYPGKVCAWDTTTWQKAGSWNINPDVKVISASVAQGGDVLVTGKTERDIGVWNLSADRQIIKLPIEEGQAASRIALSPNGEWIAIADGDQRGEIRILVAATGEESARATHGAPIAELVSSADGRLLYSESNALSSAWEPSTGRLVLQTTLNEASSTQASVISADRKLVASIQKGAGVRIWNRQNAETMSKITYGHSLAHVAFSPDDRFLAAAGEYPYPMSQVISSAEARVWDIETGREVARLPHDNAVTFVIFSPDGKWLLSEDSTGQLNVWRNQLSTGALLTRATHATGPPANFGSLNDLQKRINIVSLSPDGNLLVTGGMDGRIRAWNAETGGAIKVLKDEGWPILSVLFTSDSSRIVAAEYCRQVSSCTASVRVWDVNTLNLVAEIKRASITGFGHIALSADGHYLATAAYSASADQREPVQIWELETGNKIMDLPSQADIEAISFDQDNRYLAVAGTDNTTRIYKIPTVSPLLRLSHDRPVLQVAFNPGASLLATVTDTGTIAIWEVPSGRQVARMSVRSKPVAAIFSRNGQRLAVGGSDGTIRVLEPISGRLIIEMRHEAVINSIAFSADGSYLISAGSDQTARLWEVSSGREIYRYVHATSVSTLALSSDGRYLATGTDDGTASIWHWQPEDLINQACSHLTRNLSQTEWRQYVGPEPYRQTCPDLPTLN